MIKTGIETCAAGDTACAKQQAEGVRGVKLSELAVCASSCTFLLAAGAHRFGSPLAHIGVHEIQAFTTQVRILRRYREAALPGGRTSRILVSEAKIKQTTVQTEAGETLYREIGRYFTSMGIGQDIVRLMHLAPHTYVHWMTAAEQSSTKLVTGQTAGVKLLTTRGEASGTESSPQGEPGSDPSQDLGIAQP